MKMHRLARWTGSRAAVLAVVLLGACSGHKKPDAVTQELLSKSKEELFEKGKALVEKKKFDAGRKYLTFVFETYPNDPLGRDALLLVADSFFKQGGATGYTEARFRYRDYLNRYPGASRRDYARYQFALTYDKEIERPGQLGRLAVRSGDLLAPGETIGLPWSKSATEGARIHRKRSVQVRVAEERPCRKISARVGRVWRLGGERFFCGRFVERASICWHLLLSPYSQPDHASGQSRA